MKEVLDFLAACPAFFVATVEGDQPRVRPFSFIMEWNGKLTLATNTTKKVYRQLVANPKVEISAFDPQSGKWLRISARVAPVEEIEAKRKVFEVMPALKELYQDENNPIVACFSLEDAQADFYDFSSLDPVQSIAL